MSEQLTSIGLDVGTTTTQLVVSALTIENRASGFSVPEMDITRREIRYKSPVYLTPLLSGELVDAAGLRRILDAEYLAAGIRRDQIDTGAVIITGETSRKENARTVLTVLSDHAGDFVVATAGPDLESVLAAKGAGAVEYSEKTGKTVLHLDIGGGTTNLALIREGRIRKTGCLNVGGRLIKFDKNQVITYLSPVLRGLCTLKVGKRVEADDLEAVVRLLVRALETAAGKGSQPIPQDLYTREAASPWTGPEEPVTLSFSGGVAQCMQTAADWREYQDLGVLLGRALRKSLLCEGAYLLGAEPIRATVIGAGAHSAQLSGSTVFCQNLPLPVKNLPVVRIRHPEELSGLLSRQEGLTAVAWPGIPGVSYARIRETARVLAARTTGPLILCLEEDMAKALGQVLALELGPEASLLCIDRVRLPEGSYLDIGRPAAGTFPVVVKTLVLQ